MAQSRIRPHRVLTGAVLVVSGMVAGIGAGPAVAQVTAVRGSALGYQLSVSLFDGPAQTRGPAPTVALPAGGSSTPVTASNPTASAIVGPAQLFSSGLLEVSTSGTTSGGTVTSSSKVTNVNTSQAEVLTAGSVASTCTASGSGVTGSATVTGGVVQTDSGDDDPDTNIPNHAPTTANVAANPAPNTVIEGHLHVGETTDNFRYIFNEQITNADGSITVNAAHQVLTGPLAKGDLIIGQSICGVTGSAPASTTTTVAGATTTTVAGATTTTTAGATTTTAAPATTTTAAQTTTTAGSATTTTAAPVSTSVGGGAYGYYITLSLFGGPVATRGPVPTVTLPEAGSSTPVTAGAPTGSAVFGPATIFSSGALEVSTEGTPGGTVKSSAKVNDINTSKQEVFTATSVTSTCTASASGATGSTSVVGGKLITSEVNIDIDEDDIITPVPADPAPNTAIAGKIETVGDNFRYVFNEQVKNADGSITVNAAHLYLLGPDAAVGELIIGQSRCGTSTGTVTAASTGGSTAAGGGGGMARTGTHALRLLAFALLLAMGGWTATFWGETLRARPHPGRHMPWPKRGLLR